MFLLRASYPLQKYELIVSFYVCEKSDGIRCLMYMTVTDPEHGNFTPATYLVSFQLKHVDIRLIGRIIITSFRSYDFLFQSMIQQDDLRERHEETNSIKIQS
jgi:hypothetical protein